MAMLGHHRPASETRFEWRFASGPMVARLQMFTGMAFWEYWIADNWIMVYVLPTYGGDN